MTGNRQEVETGHGVLQYRLMEDHVVLDEYRGGDTILTIPGRIADMPVTVIGKKAFLGAKRLRTILLPNEITEIQEWAFACCSSLEQIAMPYKALTVGQGILKDCLNLQQILPTESERERRAAEDIPYLLAAVMNKLDAFYLFDLLAAGSGSWLEQWDARMDSLLEQEDSEGFSKMLLCGEEDYGSRENDLDYYIEQRRMSKVRLAMLRLFHDIGLAAPVREKLSAYLRAHRKGAATEETWKVVIKEHGDDKRYYQFLLDYGCINADNFHAVLEDMGDYHTEMKAFLIHCYHDSQKKKNAHVDLEFDF